MALVAVVADTHCYHDVDECVPGWVRERVAAAELTVHAGDFVTADALEFFEECARDLLAVRGNADVSGVDLPDVATRSIGGVTLGVTHPLGVEDASIHDAAYRQTVVEAVRAAAGPDAVAIAGHTHRLVDTTVGGTRLLNPGSATGALPAEEATMLEVVTTDGRAAVTAYDRNGPRRLDQ